MIFIKKWNTMLLFFQGHLVWKEKSNWKVHSYFKFIIYFYTLLFDKNCFVICSKIFIISRLNFCKTFFLKNVDAWFCLHDHSLPINFFLSLQNDLTKKVNLISFFNRFTKLSCLFLTEAVHLLLMTFYISGQLNSSRNTWLHEQYLDFVICDSNQNMHKNRVKTTQNCL